MDYPDFIVCSFMENSIGLTLIVILCICFKYQNLMCWPIYFDRKPVSRFEVMQLQKTMEEMLEKSGVNDADTEIRGPTQVRTGFAQA